MIFFLSIFKNLSPYLPLSLSLCPISPTHPLEKSLHLAERLSAAAGNRARIWLKREDLNHTGSHKINNAMGQVLLAMRLGKRRIIAETGAGQHG